MPGISDCTVTRAKGSIVPLATTVAARSPRSTGTSSSLDITESGTNDRFRVTLTQVAGPGTFFSVRVETGTGPAVAQQLVGAAGTHDILFSPLFGTPDLTDVQEIAVAVGGDAGSSMAISEFSVFGPGGNPQGLPALSDYARLLTACVVLLFGGALALRMSGSDRSSFPSSHRC